MSSPLENPTVRYGMSFGSAAILAIVALGFLDGPSRLIVLGLAIIEIAILPQLLERAT
ncbi:hypothetical protein [Natrinema salaciae]|uniref:Uncharacterized protein n=1 Tax=Natrinema salaciae TaxID=1186196 RepID=A0A1H9CX83_9EURY|nr:hypothetical protein [Natrinema salaciae]SEQ05795.1 hypothetical protein SAMN04489841_1183 [Natrinema salaciae]